MTDLPTPATLTPRAVGVWQEIAPALIEAGTITEVDLLALGALCEATAISRHAADILAAEGLLTDDGKRHPAVSIYNQAVAESRRLAVECGMTPASRPRVSSAEKPCEPSAWDEI
jgi:P27 family predicted phage terminase small subunit